VFLNPSHGIAFFRENSRYQKRKTVSKRYEDFDASRLPLKRSLASSATISCSGTLGIRPASRRRFFVLQAPDHFLNRDIPSWRLKVRAMSVVVQIPAFEVADDHIELSSQSSGF
jgi:hypothetical protein